MLENIHYMREKSKKVGRQWRSLQPGKDEKGSAFLDI